MDAPGDRPQLLGDIAEALHDVGEQLSDRILTRGQGQLGHPGLEASETRRCCAPSCRSRSRRLRASSAAVTILVLDAVRSDRA